MFTANVDANTLEDALPLNNAFRLLYVELPCKPSVGELITSHDRKFIVRSITYKRGSNESFHANVFLDEVK